MTLGPNWIPRASGLGMVLTAVSNIIHGMTLDWTMINWQVDLVALIGGLGLIFSKQHNVTGGAVLQPTPTITLIEKAAEQQIKIGQIAKPRDDSDSPKP